MTDSKIAPSKAATCAVTASSPSRRWIATLVSSRNAKRQSPDRSGSTVIVVHLDLGGSRQLCKLLHQFANGLARWIDGEDITRSYDGHFEVAPERDIARASARLRYSRCEKFDCRPRP